MKRSQAAMEFLLTYGWAIVVVVTAIAALSYYGVLDVSKYFAHETCTIEIGLTCLDSSVVFVPPPVPFVPAKNDASIVIKNNLGHDIEIQLIEIPEFNTVYDEYETNPERIFSGQSKTFVLGDITEGPPRVSEIAKDEKYSIEIRVKAVNVDTELEHSFDVSLGGRVQ